MTGSLSIALCALILAAAPGMAAGTAAGQTDVIKGKTAPISITCFGHASLGISWQGKQIYIDPWTQQADYSKLPKADLILVTHEHFDHFDKEAIKLISTEKTEIICTETVVKEGLAGKVCRNGDTVNNEYVSIYALPAYNMLHKKPDGSFFHPKGIGNGYVLTIDGVKILAAGDTENTPELKALKDIDVAFLPMNLPYTMTPEMVAETALAIGPKVLYPYHYGETDTGIIVKLLAEHPEIEVRIRKF